ncbi:breast cancer anti-estrogen resistance protein 3 homolog isoform X2 [Lineus longissimus]|uniref:breast cancer anti-estrogen resistance protein 3 homolog isoform X2 n=1 Tax=Lineus longissimus TaxID=88925 RepID=UPI002B4CB5EF
MELKNIVIIETGIRRSSGTTAPLIHSNSFSYSDAYPDYAKLNVTNSSPNIMSSPKQTFNIESHPWYHGNIPREKAEAEMHQDGDFIVRNSISNPGDYVLTCKWKETILHFMVNKQVEPTGKYTKMKYQFEDDLFDSVPGLINFYVTCRKPVSKVSGAIISQPVARATGEFEGLDMRHSVVTMPQRFSNQNSPIYQSTKAAKIHNLSPSSSPMSSPKNSPNATRKALPKRRISQPVVSQEKGCESRVESQRARSVSPHPQSYASLPPRVTITPDRDTDQSTYDNVIPRPLRNASRFRSGSDPNLSIEDKNRLKVSPKSNLATVPTGSESNLSKAPPPKPSRVPSIKYYRERPIVQIRNRALWEDDDKDYSDYAQVKATPSIMLDEQQRRELGQVDDADVEEENGKNGDSPVNRVSRHQPLAVNDATGALTIQGHIRLPEMNPDSFFNPLNLTTHLLQPDNKPLDSACIFRVKNAILHNSARTLAEHITKLDIDLLNVLGNDDLGMNVTSGLELMTLPQGRQLRQDILERYHCLQMLVGLVVLTCHTFAERSHTLRQWIKVALELKSNLGNLLGFAAIMDGLELPQVLRLRHTWIAFSQQFSDETYLYKMKLRPLMASLNQGTAALPLQNVCIPHIIPLVELLERDLDTVLSLTSWEENDPHQGMDIILAHLDTARIVTEQCGLYRIKGQSIVDKLQADTELLDVFSTDLHLRLLWGAKGAGVRRCDRLVKFEQLLSLLSERAEPSQQPESSV